jgi:hypothetical protein
VKYSKPAKDTDASKVPRKMLANSSTAYRFLRPSYTDSRRKINIQTIAKIGKRIPGTDGLYNSSAKGRTFKSGRKLFAAANATTTMTPSTSIDIKEKFIEKRRNIISS